MPEVIIIGGGLAGLTAARQLHKQGVGFQLLEASERVGGRVKTDVMDGFRLDHGFQVLLTAYPEAQRWLDYDALDLRAFDPGALLLYPDGQRDRIGDPLRDISSLFPTLLSKAGSIGDKLKILRLRNRLASKSIDDIFEQPERPTRDVLTKEYGFSEQMVNRFFQPFFAGIFLEKALTTSRRMFDFVFKMFSAAATSVPNMGMEELPKQLAAHLPTNSIQCNARVQRIQGQEVQLAGGNSLRAEHVIVATEATGLVRELTSVQTAHQSTIHLHFTAETAPIEAPLIGLNTASDRLTNNICVINRVAPGYAERGQLISISVVGSSKSSGNALEEAVRRECRQWFGASVEAWRCLHQRTVTYALPAQQSVQHQLLKNRLEIRPGLYYAGDFVLNGSINAAMRTGRLVAERVLEKSGQPV